MMLSSQLTVVCASAGMNDALALMWRSFCKHHGDVPFYLYANSPATKQARVSPTIYVDGPIVVHGLALDRLVAMVETPYVLVADDDVHFLAPVVEDMIAACEFCVCPPKRYLWGTFTIRDWEGEITYQGMDRIDPCCALFKTEPLKRVLRYVSFAPYRAPLLGKSFDTGSMLYHAAMAAGMSVKTPSFVWERVYHAGAITWGMAAPEGSPDRVIAEERLARIRERLRAYEEE